MNLNITQINVLVVDDSPVILSSIRRMLVKIGIQDNNIYHAKDPKAAIWHARKLSFDLIICDYNFHTKINGKQVFDELKHYHLIQSKASFIIITGESSSKIVRSIIELSPDEYILKPFNSNFFLNKVKISLERKSALYKIYECKDQRKYQDGLLACDEAEFSNSKYHVLIQKFRANFYSLLNMHKEAKELYQTIVVESDAEWANSGLADSLIELGDFSEAQKIIGKMLDKMPNSSKALSLNAKYDIYNGDIPNAIKQYSIVSELAPGNPERELIIANLCVSQGDFETAASRFMMYHDMNVGTYLESLEPRYNYIRCLLFIYDSKSTVDHLNQDIIKELQSIKSESVSEFQSVSMLRGKVDNELIIDDAENVETTHIEKELFMCHLAIIEGRLSEAVVLLKHIYKNNLADCFYDFYHFIYLLNKLNFHTEFNSLVNRTTSDIKASSESPMVVKSQLELIKSIVKHNQEQVKYIDEKFKLAQELIGNKSESEALELLIEIKSINPYIREVNLSVITCLTTSWPTNFTGQKTKKLLKDCYNVCNQLYSDKERVNLNIYELYSLAEAKTVKYSS